MLAMVACVTLLFPRVGTGAYAQRSDTTVRVAGSPRYSGVATLVEEISIGVTTGADEYMFGQIADVAVGRDGSMLIYDRQVPAVRQYDVNGRFVRTFGGRGQGPGEYRVVSGIGLLPDGRVLVWDTSGWRINVYSPSGAVLATWSTASGMSAGGVSSSPRGLLVDTAGIIWLRRRGELDRERLTFGPELYERRRGDGTVIDTIARPPFPRDERRLTAVNAAGRARHTSDLPFSPPLVWRASPLGYLITGLPDRYAFELLIPPAPAQSPATWRPGQPISSVRRTVDPSPVTRHERDSARNAVIASMRRLDPAWSWTGPEIPATKPIYHDLAIGKDGRIWVPIIPEVTARLGSVPGMSGGGGVGSSSLPQPSRLSPRDPPKPRPALYDVFEPTGAYIGQVQIPPRTTVAVRDGDRLWAVVSDEDDVQSLKRYRIVWR
jgi:hypothetical protein